MQNLRRLILLLFLAGLVPVAPPVRAQQEKSGGFTVATWNLKHFPSRNRDLKIPKEEPANILRIAAVLEADPPDILCLQELRDLTSLKKLLRAAKMKEHRRLVLSQFTQGNEEQNVPLWENVAIVTRFPVSRTTTNTWDRFGGFKNLQRGFVFMEVTTPAGPVHVYCTHLKSNFGTGSVDAPNSRLVTAINARQGCMAQLVAAMKANGSLAPGMRCIVAGDLNTQRDDPRFAQESTLRQLQEAGLRDLFAGRPRSECVTIPAYGGYPDATFDYIWFAGLSPAGPPVIVQDTAGSDHRMVRASFVLPK
jgi:endonuclease/exonuclease/phosphatase family metal-dependent hydrolase